MCNLKIYIFRTFNSLASLKNFTDTCKCNGKRQTTPSEPTTHSKSWLTPIAARRFLFVFCNSYSKNVVWDSMFSKTTQNTRSKTETFIRVSITRSKLTKITRYLSTAQTEFIKLGYLPNTVKNATKKIAISNEFRRIWPRFRSIRRSSRTYYRTKSFRNCGSIWRGKIFFFKIRDVVLRDGPVIP